MIFLVSWCDDWFLASIDSDCDPQFRCKLQAADDSKFETMGFERGGSFPVDRHYYRFFDEDPGFQYFSKLKYKGCSVGLGAIRPDTMPREFCVHSPVQPPDVQEWSHTPREGYDRYVKVDELEKVEIEAPDWSQIR